jgi:hypothetical protein
MKAARSPARADNWKHDGLNPSRPITQWMSQTPYEQMKNYFHTASRVAELVGKVAKKQLWHAKVNPVLDQLRESSKALRMPSSNVAVDEAMIRCTGRSIDTYTMVRRAGVNDTFWKDVRCAFSSIAGKV